MKKIRNIHIAIIVIGIIFNSISIFHPNIWFDEAYSVGLADKSFADIWTIGGNDVHPILYYWILHIIYLITSGLGISMNGTIIAYRIFSTLCIAILGILGITHIKKDFGEKVGVLFSFFAFFMPVTCIYSAEVRMYSLAILLVTVLAIYAHRLYKDDSNNKNWVIFGFTSLCCIYVHYYGLMVAGIINCVLLAYLVIKKKYSSVAKIMVSGVIQLLAYVPWIMCFVTQLKNVSKGFWIPLEFPETEIQIVGMQYIGNLTENLGFVIAVLLYIYAFFRLFMALKKKEDFKIGLSSILIYLSVIAAAVVITLVMKTSILYYRYLFVITGLYIFFLSFFIAKEKNKFVLGVVCITTIIMGAWSNYSQINEAYDNSNMTQIAYLKENVKPGDVIVFDENNFGTGSIVSLNFTNNKQLYYNPNDWGIEEAYKAFGSQLKIYTNKDFLNECNGRIWIIDSENSDNYNENFNNENFEIISRKVIETKYEDYVYNMILVERVK